MRLRTSSRFQTSSRLRTSRCWMGLLLLGGVVLLHACKSYQPLTIDLKGYAQRWAARSVDDRELAHFATARGLEHFDPSDGLSLDEAEVVALWFNPSLRAARLEAGVPAAALEQFSWLEDPELEGRLLHDVGGDGDWLVEGGLALSLPLSGRKGAEAERLVSEVLLAHEEALAQEWELLDHLRGEWIRWSQAMEQMEAQARYQAALSETAAAAQRMRDAGAITNMQARLLSLEQAEGTRQRLTYEQERDDALRAIFALMGLRGHTPVKLVSVRGVEADAELLDRQAEGMADTNPRMRIAQARFHVADAELREELSRQYPELRLGPALNHEGSTIIGGLFSLVLPLFDRNGSGIAAAGARREAAKSRVEAEFEQNTALLQRAFVRLAFVRERRRIAQDEQMPLAQQQLEDLGQTARLGDLDPLFALETLRQSYASEQALIDTIFEEATVLREIAALLGPKMRTEKSNGGKPQSEENQR